MFWRRWNFKAIVIKKYSPLINRPEGEYAWVYSHPKSQGGYEERRYVVN